MSNAEQQDGSVSRRRAHTDARLSEAVREQLRAHGIFISSYGIHVYINSFT